MYDITIEILKKYIPKKYHNKVNCITVAPDFDYAKNRTFQHYFIDFCDGMKSDACTIKELKDIIRKKE